jgi:hypothetical protein
MLPGGVYPDVLVCISGPRIRASIISEHPLYTQAALCGTIRTRPKQAISADRLTNQRPIHPTQILTHRHPCNNNLQTRYANCRIHTVTPLSGHCLDLAPVNRQSGDHVVVFIYYKILSNVISK